MLFHEGVPQDTLNIVVMLQNYNYHNTQTDLIAVYIPCHILTYPPGFIQAKPVPIQGAHHTDGNLKLIVHQWIFHGNPKALNEVISKYPLEGLFKLLFSNKPEKIGVSSDEL
eukprot:2482714-Ditylum_brightwellii.AAC.1